MVKPPLEPYKTPGAWRRAFLSRKARKDLKCLAEYSKLFYLHHITDNIFERLKSAYILNVELRWSNI